MKTWKTPELENLTIEATACGHCGPTPDYNCASGSEEECNPRPPRHNNPPKSPCDPPSEPVCGTKPGFGRGHGCDNGFGWGQGRH